MSKMNDKKRAVSHTSKFKKKDEEVEKGFLTSNSRSQNCGNAVLFLEDGTCFFGQGFGAARKVFGEVVFSTSMVGYPEALTDPSYQGQILTLTYPLIGNYGVPPKTDRLYGVPLYFESENIKVSGLIIHDLCDRPHHWAANRTLDDWLTEENIPGIYGIDTRRLTKKLRNQGVMLGVLEVFKEGNEPDIEKNLKDARKIPDPNLRDLVSEVTIKEPILHKSEGRKLVALIDCGVKYGILRSFLKRGVDVMRVPYNFSVEEILEYNPSGVIISNGPGDPKKYIKTIECTRELLAQNIPIMGICLGNQILALASGGDTYKLKYGHRSQNQPVLDLESGRCYITTQNHGFAVDPNSLEETDLKMWFINANDKTNEGTKHIRKTAFGFQWHPEGSPGPYDTEFLFETFLNFQRG